MTASLSNVINVALLPQGTSLARDNMNVVAVMTSQQGKLNTFNRYEAYSQIDSVATDFGTNSEVYQHATAFFGTQPNAVNAGGLFIVGYWRGLEEVVNETSGFLRGGQIQQSESISQLQNISDGSFDIDIDGVTQNITGLDFRTSVTIDDIISVIEAQITGATVDFINQAIVITSDTLGATSTVSFVTAGASGTFIGDILNLSSGSGAIEVDGVSAGTIPLATNSGEILTLNDGVTPIVFNGSSLTVESKVDAVTKLKAEVNFKGFVFISKPTDVEAKALAEWSQANNVLSYDVFNSESNLEVNTSNPVWDIKLSKLTNYRCLYSKVGNRKFATAYMARMHTVNFNAENSALTMHLKELPIAAEDYTQTEISKAKTVGLDIYTTFKRVPKVLTSGANDYVDNRYNLIAFVDAVQTDTFNLLGTTSTKIPQTKRGVNQIVDTVEKTSQGFVRAGVFAAGEWSSPDFFGDIDTFKRNIREFGFYVLAGSLADQIQSEREQRKSPVIQLAVKNAGAIHSVDVIINLNL